MSLAAVFYSLYLAGALALTLGVARALARRGGPLAERLFPARPELGLRANALVTLGYTLLGLGLAAVMLPSEARIASFEEGIKYLSLRMGALMLWLAFGLYLRLRNLLGVARRSADLRKRPLWLGPIETEAV